MPLTITRTLSVQSGDFAAAKRLGQGLGEDLRLMDDLGWAETIDRETVALTTCFFEVDRVLIGT